MSRAGSDKGWVIAVDGPAGAGKSTVARAVAERLGYIYIDTGAMYRAVALLSLRHSVPPDDVNGLLALLDHIDLRLVPQAPGQASRVLLQGEDVTEAIRSPQVNERVSEVAQHRAIRERMVALQRKLAEQGGVVMDGRDIGTVVLPHADVKVFLVADLEVRAKRRWQELQAKGHNLPLDEIRRQLIARDELDRTRAESPLRKAPDAIEIDTTEMEISEVIDAILDLCQKVGRRSQS